MIRELAQVATSWLTGTIKSLVEPACTLRLYFQYRPNIVLHDKTKHINFSRQLPLSIPVAQEPINSISNYFRFPQPLNHCRQPMVYSGDAATQSRVLGR